MLQRLVVPLLAVALGLVIVAPLAPTPALAQAEPTVKVATDPVLGKILVDGKGMTLYLYSRDEKGKSNCYNTATSQCETNWPILRPPAAGAPTGPSASNGPKYLAPHPGRRLERVRPAPQLCPRVHRVQIHHR